MLELLAEIKLNSQTTITLLQQLSSSREADSMADTELGRRLPVVSVEELELVNSDAANTDMRGRLVRMHILYSISFTHYNQTCIWKIATGFVVEASH